MIPSLPFREALVATLVDAGAIHSFSVLNAFLHTPREAFVPAYYKDWEQLVRAEETPDVEYLEGVYANESLVTKRNEKGRPTSSSSLPSVMAKMLESLDVHPGHRVLEIGTGTGYNAALLSELTGDPKLVTSIEYDAELAREASARIAQICPGIIVIIGDGAKGYQENAPYNRIIATASAPIVPLTWLEQLAPGGKIVMDLQGSLQVSGFLIIEKTESSEIVGHFKEEPLFFMPMMEPRGTNSISASCTREWTMEQNEPFPSMFDDANFRWWLQWALNGCHLRRQSQRRADGSIAHFLFFILPNGAGVRFQSMHGNTWQVKVYGEQTYHVLEQAFYAFEAAGAPTPVDYTLTMDGQPLLTVGEHHFQI